MKALRQADSLVYEACHTLDCRQWSVEVLCREEDVSSPQPPDALDQLIACARALTDDVRQTASFIQVSKCSEQPVQPVGLSSLNFVLMRVYILWWMTGKEGQKQSSYSFHF